MLFEFGLRNFFSFREGATISFRLDSKCPEEVSLGRGYTPVICVKGANASGKTQLLKGLAFLATFCADSFELDPDDGIPIIPFYDSSEPSEFFAEFMIEDVAYRYEAAMTETEVIREVLYRTKQRQVKVFEREGNTITYANKLSIGLKSINLRKNASIISTARQYKLPVEELGQIYTFFKMVTSNVTFSGLREEPRDIPFVSKFLHGNPEVFKFVKDFIKECDTGISDIDIIEVVDPDRETRYAPVFTHEHNGKAHPIIAMVESSGTKALYRDLATYHLALKYGSIVIADELDINLHPYLLSKIVDLFVDEETNPNGAQLIFSSHNTEIMDQLGRYRTYLVNKDENESFAYRLDDVPGDILRNDRAISPAYRDGKIGGVPRL